MTVKVGSSNFYVIEGDNLSDGDRAYLRSFSAYVVDGDEAGNAAVRAFVRDSVFRVIDGVPAQTFPGMYQNAHAIFEISGRLRASGVFTNTTTFYVIDGVAPKETDMALVKQHAVYAVEME